jgi:thiol-disulfide isomerase/thioredoxin
VNVRSQANIARSRAVRLVVLAGLVVGVAFVAAGWLGRRTIAGERVADSASRAANTATGPAADSGIPRSRGGTDVVGTKLPRLQLDHWLNTPGNRPVPTGSVTLYRWWTDTCPFCAASLPAIERLRQRYGPQGLQVVGVYHPKPPRPVKDEAVLAAAKRIGYTGPIAVDPLWTELRRLWLSTGDRDATSVSFLVDREGTIRYVHPGPDFFPSTDPAEARQDADYRDVERAIQFLLAEPATNHTRPE